MYHIHILAAAVLIFVLLP